MALKAISLCIRCRAGTNCAAAWSCSFPYAVGFAYALAQRKSDTQSGISQCCFTAGTFSIPFPGFTPPAYNINQVSVPTSKCPQHFYPPARRLITTAQNEESTSSVPISDQQCIRTRLCPIFWSTVIVLRKSPWGMHELLRAQCLLVGCKRIVGHRTPERNVR